MNGATVLGRTTVGNPGADWHIMGSGDYNSDGKSDILWQDASGAVGLWVTDGTSAGSSELNVAGSNAGGLFANVIAPHLTVFAGKALFVGEDASGNISLWTTDATGAGTSELAAAGGYRSGL